MEVFQKMFDIYIYIYIYIYIEHFLIYAPLHPRGVELSSEGSNGSHSRKARRFELIQLSIGVKWICVNKTKNDT